MSYGFRVENPSGTLVVDDNSIGFNYLGRPTLVALGSRAPDGLYPSVFEVVMPDAAAVPLVAIGVAVDRVSYLAGIAKSDTDPTGRTWFIYAVAVNYFDAGSVPVSVVPDLYVFAPAYSVGASWGLQIFRANGAIAWDFSMRQFWIKQAIQYGSYAGSRNYTGWSGDATHWLGDSQLWDTAGIVSPAIVGAPNGYWQIIQDTTGEILSNGTYGWRLEGSTLARRQVWTGSDKPYAEHSPYDNWIYEILATKPILIDSTGLT